MSLLLCLALLFADDALDARAAWAWAEAGQTTQAALPQRPVLKKAGAAVGTVSGKRQAQPSAPAYPLHSHRCPSCGTVWNHTDASFGNRADHTCPSCGRVQWQVYQQNVQPLMRAPTPCPGGR